MSLPRLLAGAHASGSLSLAEHEAVHGVPPQDHSGLAEAVELAGLRGRGGASFPTAVKLRSVTRRPGARAILVNGAESEPMSDKDRVLLQLAPHLVLDGAAAAAAAVGARSVVIAIPEDASASHQALRSAINERTADPRVRITDAPRAYLAGEESALIRHIDGGPLKPTIVPPRPSERGLRGRPTLVQNPETLANIALIARHGPEWFRQLGTPAHPGSALVTVSGAVRRAGVQEIACGTALDAVLAAAGGATEALRAVLVGGFHGAWIGGDEIAATTIDDAGLSRHGGGVAAGVIVALGRSACPAQELARTMQWLALQNAGQCGPCSNGLPALAVLLTAMTAGRGPADGRQLLERWSTQLLGRGACKLPDGAVRFLSSGLRVFGPELADHARHGRCDNCGRAPTLMFSRERRSAAA